MHINKIFTFNHAHKGLWVNPDQQPRGKVVIVDVSGSMEDKYRELKLCLGMLRCLAGLDALPPVPPATGGTNLLGVLLELLGAGVGEQEFIIFTDGQDNGDILQIQTDVAPDGSAVYTHLNRSESTYLAQRQEAVLDFMTKVIRADVHLIGLGHEVKELLRMAASRPMTVAHVPLDASSRDVVSVLNATLRTPPGEDHASRIITIDNLCGHEAVSEDVAATTEASAQSITITDEPFTIETLKAAFDHAEASASIKESAKTYTRAAVLWLVGKATSSAPVPGAAIGGKFSALFAPPPCSTSDWKVNQLLYHLKLAGVLVASKSEAVELHWNDQSRRFNKVECYEASERARHLIGELRADASFAVSEDALVQRKTNKRALS